MSVIQHSRPSISGRTLRDYQEKAIEFLLGVDNYLLADPPGAGKTAMACRALHMEAGPVLIVTNNSVKYYWEDELRDWVDPNLRIEVYEPWYVGDKEFWSRDADVFIIHWEGLVYNETVKVRKTGKKKTEAPKRPRPERHLLTMRRWGTIIADEAHRAKNHNSQQSRVLRTLKARYRAALTASPIINRPDELWALLNFLYPSTWSSYWKFFEAEVLAVPRKFGGYDIIGWKNAEGMTARLRKFTVRRSKSRILPELPPKTYTKITVPLHADQRKAYDEMVKKFVTQLPDKTVLISPTVLSQMMRLRQIACGLNLVSSSESSSKLDAVVEWVLNRYEEEPDLSVVVFSQFVEMVHAYSRRMEAKGFPAFVVTGQDTGAIQRQDFVTRFQAGERRGFAATVQTMGESATLTRASVAIFLDQVWSPKRQEQAEDRIHRIGQDRPVTIVIFEARDTVEQKIAALLKTKGEFSNTVMDRTELIEMLS